MYSVRSRGRIVGHTDLGFVYRHHGVRVGWFYPNQLGEKLMPAATGVASAMRDSRANGTDFRTDPDVASAFDHESALELELRESDGKLIETEGIAIIDTHHLLALADCAVEEREGVDLLPEGGDPMFDDEMDEWVMECESEEPWRESVELPRYQIQAYLVDHHAIP